MFTDPSTVFVVDDDPDIRASLTRLFGAVSIPIESYESAESFLESESTRSPGCLLLDVRMPGMSGMQLLRELQNIESHPQVILLTGHGDIPMVLQALKLGALDFIEKPPHHERLLESVRHAFEVDREQRRHRSEKHHFQELLTGLTNREREVLDRMVSGTPYKAIAQDLGISERTLEKHREHVMKKMHASSIHALIREMVLYQVESPGCL